MVDTFSKMIYTFIVGENTEQDVVPTVLGQKEATGFPESSRNQE